VLHPRSWHLAQARGPLSALRTLGAMLAPRARGTFESDMAEGIVVQVSPGASSQRSAGMHSAPWIVPSSRGPMTTVHTGLPAMVLRKRGSRSFLRSVLSACRAQGLLPVSRSGRVG